MGGCASKPKDLDTENVPATVEAPAVAAEEQAVAVEAPALEKFEAEAEALVDLSESAPEAPKTEETKEEAKEEVVPAEAESKPAESEAKVVVEAKEEKNEVVA